MKLGLVFAAMMAALLTFTSSGAARAQSYTVSSPGPNHLTLVDMSSTTLKVSMALLGYQLNGDAAFEDPNDWDVGPYFSPTIVASTPDNSTAIGRIYWLEPGSSMSDLPDAKFAAFDLTECFCSAKGPAISFHSQLSWGDLTNSSSEWWDFGCRSGSAFVGCPILNTGASQAIPISVIPFGSPTYQADDLVVRYVDARGGAAVPEPAAWMLMLIGFGSLGSAMRQRSSLKRAA